MFFDTGVRSIRKKLQDDVDRITATYYNKGFLNVHVPEPAVHAHVGNSLKVVFVIDEGPVFHVGTDRRGRRSEMPKKDLLSTAHGQAGRGFSRRRACSMTC